MAPVWASGCVVVDAPDPPSACASVPPGVADGGVVEAGSSGPSSSGALELFSRWDASDSCWASLAPPSAPVRVACALGARGSESRACGSVAVLREGPVWHVVSSSLGDWAAAIACKLRDRGIQVWYQHTDGLRRGWAWRHFSTTPGTAPRPPKQLLKALCRHGFKGAWQGEEMYCNSSDDEEKSAALSCAIFCRAAILVGCRS